MKKSIVILLGAVMISLHLNAQTNISTSITTNTTWTSANSPYIISNSINVNAGITLTITDGVEVRFNSGVYLQVLGTLTASVTRFTANGSTTKGFWDGLYVSNESAAAGLISLTNCTVEYARNLYSRKGELSLNGCTINNFSEHGVRIYTQGVLTISNTSIQNTSYPVSFYGPGKLNPGVNVVLTGNTNDYVYLNFNDISNVFELPNPGIPYYNTFKRVSETGTWVLKPGVKLYTVNTEITVEGKIRAKGTKTNPVIFDMLPSATHWIGININAKSIDTACIFRNCLIRNAIYDYDPYCAVEINNASPTFDSCRFTGNSRNLLITGLSSPQFSNCSFGSSITQSGECYNIAMDLNSQPVFTSDSIYFNTKEIRAIKITDATVTEDGHLKKVSFINLGNITYCLYGNSEIKDTASVVIDPGLVIKCRDGNARLTGNGVITGIGTISEPIIFTHIADDNFGNPADSQNNGPQNITNSSSGRIQLYSKAVSKIEYWKIYYAGYNQDYYALYASDGNIIKNCEIKNSYRGVWFSDNAQIINNNFLNINSFPLARHVEQGTPVLLGNTISNVGNMGILITGFGDDSPTLRPMDFAGNTNVAYMIESAVTINAGSIVKIDPSVVIKFFSGGRILVNGGLNATGKPDRLIIFTSIHDDSASGDTNNNGTGTSPGNNDWNGIDFSATSSDNDNFLKNCEVRYVTRYTSDINAAIRITSAKVVMDSIKINFSSSCGIAIMGDANPQISNCQLYNINDAPVYMDLFSNPVFGTNIKLANLLYTGLRLRGKDVSGTVPARNFAGYNTITYILDEDMTVTNQLVIPAGLTFKGKGNWNVRGKLDVLGTTQNPVVFTTIEDDAWGNPGDSQQNGNTTPGTNGNSIIFYDEANDNSVIDHAIFRYSEVIPVQITNASPKIRNSLFENTIFEGIALYGSSTPSIESCTFNNITFPFRTSLVTYPASATGNIISGTTGKAIRINDEILTNNVTMMRRSFGGIDNIPYAFQNYTVGTGAKLTISPGIVLKFMQNGTMNIQNGLIAIGGSSPDSTIVFTSDRDDFYGGDTYGDGDANQPTINYWNGIYFYNEAIDENCILKNCILKNGSVYYGNNNTANRGAVTVNNASPTIENCLFRNNWYGIVSVNISLPRIIKCDFMGADTNYGYGVWNITSSNMVTAEGCWWNSNTGPRHTSNPGGTGERVSDYVDFTPWATQLAKPVLGDVSLNGTISPYDASLVLQHSVGNITLSSLQQGVADVSRNGSITAYDASLILQFTVGIINRFDTSRTKSALISNLASISFADIEIAADHKNFALPVILSSQRSVKAMEIKFTSNPRHLRFSKANHGNLPSLVSVVSGYNPDNGEIALALASAYDLALQYDTIRLEFELADPSISTSYIDLKSALANETKLPGSPVRMSVNTLDIITASEISELSQPPVVWYENNVIHITLKQQETGYPLEITLCDLKGRILTRKVIKESVNGFFHSKIAVQETGKVATGIFILRLGSGPYRYSQKLFIQ